MGLKTKNPKPLSTHAQPYASPSADISSTVDALRDKHPQEEEAGQFLTSGGGQGGQLPRRYAFDLVEVDFSVIDRLRRGSLCHLHRKLKHHVYYGLEYVGKLPCEARGVIMQWAHSPVIVSEASSETGSVVVLLSDT